MDEDGGGGAPVGAARKYPAANATKMLVRIEVLEALVHLANSKFIKEVTEG